MAKQTKHIPALYQATLEHLAVGPGALIIDGTLGGGGHAAGLLRASAPTGRLLGFDRDAAALGIARQYLAEFGERARYCHASYRQMGALAPGLGFGQVDAILLDLGYSSLQMDDPKRGFAFRLDGPLDMRFDTRDGSTAADLINNLGLDELATILYEYGEENDGRRVAQAIVRARPIDTTRALAELVTAAKPPKRGRRHIHPATKTFQALRIAVNDELQALQQTLPQAVQLLVPGGRLGVISFHSLEDRIVKRFIKSESRACVCPPKQPICTCGGNRATLRAVTRKPIMPTAEERAANPRSRSAKLRVAVRLPAEPGSAEH